MADENVFEGMNLGIEDTGETSDEKTTPTESPTEESARESAPTVQQDDAVSVQQETTRPGTPQQADDRGAEQQVQSANTPPQQRIVRADSQGNLIDQNGQVVARAGAERRLYDKATDATTKLEQATGQLQLYANKVQELQQQVNTQAALDGIPSKMGLQPQEATVAMQLMKSWKSDPIATIKYLLTEAKAMGHTVDIEGMAPTTDMGAIARMIDERLQPFQQDREVQQREIQARQNAERQYMEFINNPAFVNARTHENEIAQLLRSDPNLSLDAAYYKLQSYALARGLDFAQPLGPQLQMLQQQGTQGVANGDTAPLVPGGGNAPVQEPASTYADPSTSYDAIIRQVMGST